MTDRTELDRLIERSKQLVEAMTPEQLAEMREEQRQSWMRAMRPCEHGWVDFEQCPDCRRIDA